MGDLIKVDFEKRRQNERDFGELFICYDWNCPCSSCTKSIKATRFMGLILAVLVVGVGILVIVTW